MGPVQRPTTSKLSRTKSQKSPLLLVAAGSPHGNLLLTGTVLATHPLYIRGGCGLGDVHSGGHNAALGTKAAHGLACDLSTSAFPNSPARFNRNVVLKTAIRSVLKLPVFWASTRVSALTRSIYRLQCSSQSAPICCLRSSGQPVPTGRRMATR